MWRRKQSEHKIKQVEGIVRKRLLPQDEVTPTCDDAIGT